MAAGRRRTSSRTHPRGGGVSERCVLRQRSVCEVNADQLVTVSHEGQRADRAVHLRVRRRAIHDPMMRLPRGARSPFSAAGARPSPCPKMASLSRPRPVQSGRARESHDALPGPAARDPRFDGRLLRRRDLDRHLLPADLPGPDAAARELPLLRQRGRRPSRRASAPACAAGPSWPPATRRSTTPSASPGCRGALEDGHARRRGGPRGRSPTQLELSSRQLRRIVQQELGVSPIELAADAPAAAGQAAAHRDDAARHRGGVRQRLRQPPPLQRRVPRALRHAAHAAAPQATRGRRRDRRDARRCTLAYRPPLDWAGCSRSCAPRALTGVECIADDRYFAHGAARRARQGWIRVTPVRAKQRALSSSSAPRSTPVLPALLAPPPRAVRSRRAARRDRAPTPAGPRPRAAVAANPGLRVPGAFDGFELAVRAILGQQITVKAATTMAGRFVDAFGEPIETPHAALTRLSPPPARLAARARRRAGGARASSPARAREHHRAGRGHVSGALCARRRRASRSRRRDRAAGRSCPASAPGPRTTSRCARCAGPTPSRAATSPCWTASAASRPSRRTRYRSAWQPWRSYAMLHLWNRPR